MGSIGKAVQVKNVNLDPSTIRTEAMLVVSVQAVQVTKKWIDYKTSTWGSVSKLTW